MTSPPSGRRRAWSGISAQACGIARAPAILDPQVATVGPAQLLQRLKERREASLWLQFVRGCSHEHADTAHPVRWLRAREIAVRDELDAIGHYIQEAQGYLAQIRVLHEEALVEFSRAQGE
jgi:hypothetical protein